MAHAVLMTAQSSPYNDHPGERYHFPKTYLGVLQKALGDWVVLYEPQTSGKRGYYAFQRLARVTDDPQKPGHFYALFDDFIGFDRCLPRLRANGSPYESTLPKRGGNNFCAVRSLSASDLRGIFTAAIAPANKRQIALAMGLGDYISSTITTPGTDFKAPFTCGVIG